ncbi:unnamed protein product [Closterium sp. Naga37s-1]|nr:unnamed protein product [Closterium sp. Naga37s-1]
MGEVAMLWAMRHTNLQRLLGYCWEKRGTAFGHHSPAAAAAAAAATAAADNAKSTPPAPPPYSLHAYPTLHASASLPACSPLYVSLCLLCPLSSLSLPLLPSAPLLLPLCRGLRASAQQLMSRNTTAQLRAAHLPQAPDAIVLPMVRLALSCTASDPLARPTVTDLLRSIKALKRSLSAHPRPALPGNAGTSRDGDRPRAVSGRGPREPQGGEGGDGLSGGFSQNALDAKLDWLVEEEDSGRFVTDV